MWITEPAGTWNNVVCTHLRVFGSWMKYETQSGLSVTVFCASSCMTTLTTAPVSGLTFAPNATVGGVASKKWITRKAAPTAPATNATTRGTTRASRDTGHHLASARARRPGGVAGKVARRLSQHRRRTYPDPALSG